MSTAFSTTVCVPRFQTPLLSSATHAAIVFGYSMIDTKWSATGDDAITAK